MRLVDIATERRVTIGMFMVAIILFGLVSLDRLSVTLLPDLNYPSLTIRTELSGAAPEEIETLLSKPIEEASGVIKNLKKIHSISRAGQSDVTLQFAWGTNMDFASIDVREKIDLLNIPLEASKPVLLRFDPGSEPIMRYALVSGEDDDVNTLKKLRRYADERLKTDLESVEGTASVKVSGGYEDEIQITVDQENLSQLGLSIQAIADRLQQDNINLSGGQIEEDSRRFQVRTVNEFTSLDDIRNTIVSLQDNQPVYLRDLAEVRMHYKQRKAIIRVDGKEAIDLAIYKEGDANTVQVAKRLANRIDRYKSLAQLDKAAAEAEKARIEAERKAAENKSPNKAGKKSNIGPKRGRGRGRGRGGSQGGGDQFKNIEKLPEFADLKLIQDQSRFISEAINQVKSAALLGGLLAILVLYGFLRNARATFIIGLTIPVSVIGTFFLMYNMDLSLNIMSLGGIALAIGLLVDNSIVVLENIAQKREKGLDLIPAAREGTSQVAMAVTASTLTTVAVFFPMIFITGIAGQLFKDQALTVSFALLFSLIVALTLIPMLSSIGGSKRFVDDALDLNEKKSRKILSFLPLYAAKLIRLISSLVSKIMRLLLSPMAWLFQFIYLRIASIYDHLLKWSLQNRLIVMSATLLVFLASIGLIPKLGTELIPKMSQGEFYVDLHLQPGSSISSTDAIMQQLPSALGDQSKILLTGSTAGTGNRLDAAPIDSGDNTGRFSVVLKPESSDQEESVKAKLRSSLNQVPGLTYEFGQPELVSFSTPLEIEISGYDLGKLSQASASVIQAMNELGEFRDVSSSIELGQPEIQIIADPEKAAQLGLSERAIANSVVDKIRGNVATRYSWRDRKIDVLIRSLDSRNTSVQEVSQLIINPESDRPVTLASVAEIRENIGPASIHRIDQSRVALITANVINIDIGKAVEILNETLERLSLPTGVSAVVKGQSEEMESAFASMQFALLLAIFLVYLVMASQFESLIHPFVILFTIPLALIGAILALYVTNTTINVVALIGLIMLAGIVVNNGIVLIDLINQLRADGISRAQAILQGGKDRLRPILMTAMTTILGLLPMAIGVGEGSEIRAPMAITVIGGMLVATFLTLIVIPVMYSLLDRKRYV